MSVYRMDKEGVVRDFFSKRPVKRDEAAAVLKAMSEENSRGDKRNLQLARTEKMPFAQPGAN